MSSIKKRDKEAKIKKIVQVALKMIREKGYTETTTNHIAKAANVSIGLVYKYFPDGKPGIIKEVARRSYREVIDEKVLSQITPDNLEKLLRGWLFATIRLHRKDKALMEAYEIAYLSNKEVFDDFYELIGGDLNPIPKILDRLEEIGIPNVDKMRKFQKPLILITDSIIHRHIFEMKIFDTDEELVDFLIDTFLSILQIGKK